VPWHTYTQAADWARANNPLEEAVDPLTGTKDKWDKFASAGGLKSVSSFHGMHVSKLEPAWNGEKLTSFVMEVDPSLSSGAVKSAMNQACGTSDADWKIMNQEVVAGKEAVIALAVKGKVACGMALSPWSAAVTFDARP